MSIAPGARFDRYEILSLLGKGGMGEVHLAADTKLDRKVALKLLPAQFTQDEDRVRRFVQEAKAASALNHPNIITIHEIGEVDGSHYIATEFIDGQTLRQQIASERLPLSAALEIAIQTASALSAAHEAGIVHRDIKPENVMVRRDGIVKVLDFGLAKLAEQSNQATDKEAATMKAHTNPGTVMGTASYMSPEQARGQVVDARTDIFSLGIVLYEVLAGRAPFEGVNAIETMGAILNHEPLPVSQHRPDVPAELQRMVSKALRKDREERYQSIKDLLVDLKDFKRELEFTAQLQRSSQSSGGVARQSESRSGPALPSYETVRLEAMPTGAGSPAHPTSSAEYIVSEIKRHKTGTLVILLMIVLGSGFAYMLYRLAFQAKPTAAHFQNPKLARLTTEGNINSVIISPDGKYLAYALLEGGKLSLWTKHLATGSRVQIAPPSETTTMFANAFTSDGSYVYYIVRDEPNPQGALYQVPVLGGVPKKILTEINTPITFSPDSQQFAFGRYDPSTTEFSFFIAKADGTEARKLIARKRPESFGQNGASWSPDGKLIAFGYGNQEGGEHMTVAVVSVENGTFKPITSQRWKNVGRVAWFSDGSGLAVVAQEQGASPQQIWQVSYPSGEARRITNDLNSYSSASLALTADSSALVTVQNEVTANIWLMPSGETSRAQALTTQRNVRDGANGLSWTPEGKLTYASDRTGKQSIWGMNADGSDQKLLLENPTDSSGAGMTPDGRYLIFFSLRSKTWQIWRADIDGSNPKQLTSESGIKSADISPDGRWMLYAPLEGGIKKVSIDGGAPVKVSDEPAAAYAQMSYDGKLLAYFFTDGQTRRSHLALIPAEGGAIIKTFDLPVTASSNFGWLPDNRALIYINTVGGVSNLWRQPLDGSAAKPITDFKSDLIHNFAYSGDGKRLALSRGNQSRDAVMITDSK